MVKFGKQGKLFSIFIRPYEVLEMVGTVAYKLALPPNLSGVHEVFHVSVLWKYTPNLTHLVDWGEIVVHANGTFEEGPVHIINNREQVFQGKTVRLVKVLWQHRGVEEETRDRENTIRTNYSFLFEDGGMFFCHLLLNDCSICM